MKKLVRFLICIGVIICSSNANFAAAESNDSKVEFLSVCQSTSGTYERIDYQKLLQDAETEVNIFLQGKIAINVTSTYENPNQYWKHMCIRTVVLYRIP